MYVLGIHMGARVTLKDKSGTTSYVVTIWIFDSLFPFGGCGTGCDSAIQAGNGQGRCFRAILLVVKDLPTFLRKVNRLVSRESWCLRVIPILLCNGFLGGLLLTSWVDRVQGRSWS